MILRRLDIAALSAVVVCLGLSGCGGGGSGGGDATDLVTVSGTIVDSNSTPVAGATVTVTSDPVSTVTDAQGKFSVEVEPGTHTLTATKNGVDIVERFLTATSGEPTNLHQLSPTWPYYSSGATWFKDTDDDGYSDGTSENSVSQPTGYQLAADLIATNGDCDDSAVTVNPAAAEVCGNGIDDDCSGGDQTCDGTTSNGVVPGNGITTTAVVNTILGSARVEITPIGDRIKVRFTSLSSSFFYCRTEYDAIIQDGRQYPIYPFADLFAGIQPDEFGLILTNEGTTTEECGEIFEGISATADLLPPDNFDLSSPLTLVYYGESIIVSGNAAEIAGSWSGTITVNGTGEAFSAQFDCTGGLTGTIGGTAVNGQLNSLEGATGTFEATIEGGGVTRTLSGVVNADTLTGSFTSSDATAGNFVLSFAAGSELLCILEGNNAATLTAADASAITAGPGGSSGNWQVACSRFLKTERSV